MILQVVILCQWIMGSDILNVSTFPLWETDSLNNPEITLCLFKVFIGLLLVHVSIWAPENISVKLGTDDFAITELKIIPVVTCFTLYQRLWDTPHFFTAKKDLFWSKLTIWGWSLEGLCECPVIRRGQNRSLWYKLHSVFACGRINRKRKRVVQNQSYRVCKPGETGNVWPV